MTANLGELFKLFLVVELNHIFFFFYCVFCLYYVGVRCDTRRGREGGDIRYNRGNEPFLRTNQLERCVFFSSSFRFFSLFTFLTLVGS